MLSSMKSYQGGGFRYSDKGSLSIASRNFMRRWHIFLPLLPRHTVRMD